jgi:hypothetical protein
MPRQLPDKLRRPARRRPACNDFSLLPGGLRQHRPLAPMSGLLFCHTPRCKKRKSAQAGTRRESRIRTRTRKQKWLTRSARGISAARPPAARDQVSSAPHCGERATFLFLPREGGSRIAMGTAVDCRVIPTRSVAESEERLCWHRATDRSTSSMGSSTSLSRVIRVKI